MEQPKKELYKKLNADGVYTKSYEEFESQFSSPEKQEKLYQKLNSDGKYTKSKDEFVSRFFADPVKKKVGTEISKPIAQNQELALGQENGSSVMPTQKFRLPNESDFLEMQKQGKLPKDTTYSKPKFNEKELYDLDAKGKVILPTDKQVKKNEDSIIELSNIAGRENRRATDLELNNFKNSTTLTPQEIEEKNKEVDDEININGFWNTAKNYGIKALNTMSGFVAGMTEEGDLDKELRISTDPLSNYKEEFLKKEEEKGVDTSKLSKEQIFYGAKDLLIKEKKDKLKEDKTSLYIDSLSEEEKNALNLNKLFKRENLNEKDKVYLANTELSKQEIENTNSEMEKIITKFNNKEELSQAEVEFAKNYEAKSKDLVKEYEDNYIKYQKNNSELGSVAQEYDLLKRDYDLTRKSLATIGGRSAQILYGLATISNDLLNPYDESRIAINDKLAESNSKVNDLLKNNFQKNTEDWNGIGDAFEYVVDVISNQLPNLTLMAATGGSSMVVPLLSIGAYSTGNKINDLTQSNNEGKTFYTEDEIRKYAYIAGAGEMLETGTMGNLVRFNKFMKASFNNPQTRELFLQTAKESLAKSFKSITKSLVSENAEELGTMWIDIMAKEKFLGVKTSKKEIADLTERTLKDTSTMSLLMSATPQIAHHVMKPITPKSYVKKLDENTKEILRLNNELKKTNLTKEESDIIKKSLDNKISENKKMLENVLDRNKNLDDEQRRKAIELELSTSELRNEATSIKKSTTIDKDVKVKLLKDLEVEYKKQEALRENIASGTASILDIVSEEKKEKMKSNALKVLVKEKEGTNEANFTNDVIEKKAIEIYNKEKQTKSIIENEQIQTTVTETKPQAEVPQQAEAEKVEKTKYRIAELNNELEQNRIRGEKGEISNRSNKEIKAEIAELESKLPKEEIVTLSVSESFNQAGENAKSKQDGKVIGRWILDNSKIGDTITLSDGTGYEITNSKNGEIEITPFETNEKGEREYIREGVRLVTENQLKQGDLFESSYENNKGERITEKYSYNEAISKPQEVSPTEDVVAPSVVEGETKKINGKELTFYKLEGDNTDSGFAVEKNKDGYVIQSALLPFSKQKQGIGTDFYVRINNESIEKTGSPLKSSENLSNSGGKPFWEKLVDKGLAEKTEDGFKFKEQTKVTNETAPSQDSTIDGNIRPRISNVAESGITEQQSPAEESVQSANDVKPTKGKIQPKSEDIKANDGKDFKGKNKITQEPTLEDISNFLNENFKPNEANNPTKVESVQENSALGKGEKPKKPSQRGKTPLDKRKIKDKDVISALRTEVFDAYSLVQQYFIGGGRVLPSEVKKLFNSDSEAKIRIGFTRTAQNKGATIDGIANYLWEQHGENLGLNTEDFRDAVEQVISDFVSTKAMALDLNKRNGLNFEESNFDDSEFYADAKAMELANENDHNEAISYLDVLTDDEIIRLADEQTSFEDFLTNEENKQSKSSLPNADKIRKSPTNSITFLNPIIGKNGAKLLSYTWESKDFGKDNDGKTIRFSDWEKAGLNADTGRSIVHKFKVEVNGNVIEVSADSLAKTLGFTNPEMEKVFPKAKDFVKQLAKLKMRETALRNELSETDNAISNAVDKISKEYGVKIEVYKEGDKVLESSYGMPKEDGLMIGSEYATSLVTQELRNNGVLFNERRKVGAELKRVKDLIEKKKQVGNVEFLVNEENKQSGKIKVKSFKKGAGGTLGIFEGEDGKLYKSTESLYNKYNEKSKQFEKAKTGKTTEEYKFLSENQDLKHLPKVGKLVKTSEGSAFEIEKLNEVNKGTLTFDEINQIQETLTELNRRGVFVNDINTVMRRDNGDIVLIDLSNASDNDMGQETVSREVADLLNTADKDKYDAYSQSQRQSYLKDLFPDNSNKDEYTYLLTQRPPSIGTHPIDNLVKQPEEIKLGNREAYKLTYSKPLSKEDISRFELTKETTYNDIGRIFEVPFGKSKMYQVIDNVSPNEVTITNFYNGKTETKKVPQRGVKSVLDERGVEVFPSKKETIKTKKQQRKYKANADKSILNSDKDLLGNEKEEAMIPLTYEENPDFNVDDVVYIKSDRNIDKFGKRNKYSVRGKDENGKYVLWGKSNGANLNVDFSEIEKGVNQKRYPLTGSLDAIDYAMGEKLYSEWVKEGRMSASDAKIIIESAGFNVPSDIQKLTRKDKVNAEVDAVVSKNYKTKFTDTGEKAFTSSGFQIGFKTRKTFDESLGINFFTIAAYSNKGKKIGYAKFILEEDGSLTGNEVEVDKKYQSKGVGTAIYENARYKGFVIKPSVLQTPEGRALWNSLNNSAKQQRKDKANAEVDKIADKIKDLLPGIKDPDLKKQGFSQDQLIDLVAKAVKNLISAGIEIDEAIRQVSASIKERFNIDVNADDVKAKIEPKKEQEPFERKEGKKSVLTRASQGNSASVKKAISKYSLDYEIENQETAKANAKKFVDEVGIENAFEAVKSNQIPGAEGAFVYAEIIRQINANLENFTDEELIQYEETNMQILGEVTKMLDEKSRSAGRFISALGNIYQSSDGMYNLSVQVNKYKANNGGTIPADVLEKFTKANERIKELEKQIAEAQKIREEQESARSIEEIIESISRKNKIDRSKPISDKAKAKAFADKLRSFKTTSKKTLNASTPFSLAFDGAIELIATSIEAGGKISDAIKQGLDYIRKQNLSKEEENQVIAGVFNAFEESERVQRGIKIDDAGNLRIPHSVLREKVEAGITNVDDLVTAIKADVDELFPDEEFTERQVRDAITQYGKITNPTKDEVEIEISIMKSLGKLLSGLEDAYGGKRPQRSGLQRRPLTTEERTQMRKLRELMRDLPFDEADLRRAYKTALDAIKSRLTNEITDLDQQIANGEKRKGEKKAIEYDAEANALKAERDQKRQLLDELVGKPELTEEERINKAEILLEKSIVELQEKIDAGDIAYKSKPTPLNSEKLKSLREQKKALLATMEQMRQDSGLAEMRRIELAKNARIKRIAELKRRLDEKDFSKKERKPLPIDAELAKLEAETMELKETYDKEVYKLELKNQTKAQKFGKLLLEILNIPKILSFTIDASFIGIQGGMQFYRLVRTKPRKAMTIFTNTVKAMFNAKTENRYHNEIKSNPNYPLWKKSKLAITEVNYKTSAQEELFQHNIINSTFDALGDKLQEKGYTKIGDFVRNYFNFFKIFERGQTYFLNQMRINRFDEGATILRSQGKNELDDLKEYEKVASAVNTLTGRANTSQSSVLANLRSLNGTLFSSFANWLSVINQLNPYWYATLTPTARKMALSDLLHFIGAVGGFMTLATLASSDDEEPFTVETDPRSSDFMLLKKGNLRIDPWQTKKSHVVFMARILPYIGGVKNADGEIVEFGVDRNDKNRLELAWQYMSNKFSPGVSNLIQYTSLTEEKEYGGVTFRENKFGEDYKMSKMFIPLYIQSLKEVAKEQPNAFGKSVSLLNYFGLVNVGIYGGDDKGVKDQPDYDEEGNKTVKAEKFSFPKMPSLPKLPSRRN